MARLAKLPRSAYLLLRPSLPLGIIHGFTDQEEAQEDVEAQVSEAPQEESPQAQALRRLTRSLKEAVPCTASFLRARTREVASRSDPPTLARMRFRLALLFLVGLWLVGCTGDDPAPDPADLIDSAADHLEAAEGFRFRISRQGQPVELGGWLIRELSGTFAAPDAADSRAKVSLGGLIVEVGIVSIGPDTWQQDPLSGAWTLLDPNSSVAVAGIFGPGGLAAVIRNDLDSPAFVGTEQLEDLPGEDLHHLVATLDAKRLQEISAGLIPGDPATVDLYFAENGELRRVVIPDTTGGWIIDAWGYGPGYAVEPPA